jgi:uncharacterized protein
VRQDVTFSSQGVECSGWLYVPDDLAPGQKRPAVVMAHGLSGVKEMGLDHFGQRFAAAGLVALVFDYRFFGSSEGEPRGQVMPLEQSEDFRNAASWVSDQPQVDPDRLGIWGSSLGGAIALYTATWDKRFKAVVAQVPYAYNYSILHKADPERWELVGKMLIADRVARYKTGANTYRKVVAQGEPCSLPTPDAYEWFTGWGPLAPTWENAVTMAGVEKIKEFDPISQLHLISPTPVLVIAAEQDSAVPLALVQAAYERIPEAKSLVVLPCGHFDVYQGQWAERAADLATEWFTKHLR